MQIMSGERTEVIEWKIYFVLVVLAVMGNRGMKKPRTFSFLETERKKYVIF